MNEYEYFKELTRKPEPPKPLTIVDDIFIMIFFLIATTILIGPFILAAIFLPWKFSVIIFCIVLWWICKKA